MVNQFIVLIFLITIVDKRIEQIFLGECKSGYNFYSMKTGKIIVDKSWTLEDKNVFITAIFSENRWHVKKDIDYIINI